MNTTRFQARCSLLHAFSVFALCLSVLSVPGAVRPALPTADDPATRSTLRLVKPVEGDTFVAPTTVRINVVAVDPKSDIRRVDFFANSEPIGSSEHLTKDAVIPGRPREHTVDWRVSAAGKYEIVAKAKATEGEISSNPVTITVLETSLPVVSIYSTVPETSEPAPNIRVRPGVFTLKRTGDTANPLTVFLAYEGSATPGVDYQRLPESVTFPVGAAEVELLVGGIEDSIVEEPETIVARLNGSPLDRLPNHVVDPQNDTAKVVLHDSTKLGGAAWLEITTPKDGEAFKAGQTITIEATAVDPAGYIAFVEFYDFDRLLGASRIDFIRAPDPGTPIYHSFEWQNPTPGEHRLTARAVDSNGDSVVSKPVHIKIVMDGGEPSFPVVQIATEDPEATEFSPFVDGFDPARFTISREGDLSGELEVFFSLHGTAIPDVDYRRPGRSVIIPAGARDVTLEIVPLSDEVQEEMETVAVRLEDPRPISSVPKPPTLYDVAPFLQQAAGVIFDRQPPEGAALEIALPGNGGVYQERESVRILAAAFHPSEDLNRVEFYSGEQLLGFSEITFGKILPGGLIMHYFEWTNPTPGDHFLTARSKLPDGSEVVSGPVEIKVWPSASPVVVLDIATTDEIASEPGADGKSDVAVFTIRRIGGPKDVPVTVLYKLEGAALNGVDYERLSGQVLLPAGVESVDLTIVPLADKALEGEETAAVILESPVCPAIFPVPPYCYQIGNNSGAKVLIRDFGGVVNSDPPAVSIVEPQNGSAFATTDSVAVQVVANDTVKVERLDLLIDDVVVESTKLPSLEFKWTGLSAGTHVISARVLDSGGVERLAAPIKVLAYSVEVTANDDGKALPLRGIVPARFEKIECHKDGKVLLQLAGTADGLSVIEVSTDLIHWSPLAPVFLPSGEVFYQDKSTVGEKQRFYRTRVE